VNARTFRSTNRLKFRRRQIGGCGLPEHVATPAKAENGITYPVAYLSTLKPGESNESGSRRRMDSRRRRPPAASSSSGPKPRTQRQVGFRSRSSARTPEGSPRVSSAVEGTAHEFRDAEPVETRRTYEYTVQAIARIPTSRTPRAAVATVRAGFGEGARGLQVIS